LRQEGGVFFQKDTAPAGDGGRFLFRLHDQITSQLAESNTGKIILGIRPEHIKLGDDRSEFSVEAMAEAIEPFGPETYLHLMNGGHSFVSRIPHDCRIGVGQKVRLVFDANKAHFFDPKTEKSIRVQ